MVVKHVVYHRSVNLPHFPAVTNNHLGIQPECSTELRRRRLAGAARGEAEGKGVRHTPTVHSTLLPSMDGYHVHTGSPRYGIGECLYVCSHFTRTQKKQVIWKEGPFL